MSNPIFTNNINSQQSSQQTNSLFGIWNQVRNSPNPNQMMQTLLSNDPRFIEVMNYINQNGGDAKSAFYNMAAQKGIDPNSILNQLK